MPEEGVLTFHFDREIFANNDIDAPHRDKAPIDRADSKQKCSVQAESNTTQSPSGSADPVSLKAY